VHYTTVAKADANARTAYVHFLVYNWETKKARVHSHLEHISPALASQPAALAVVDKWVAAADAGFHKDGFDIKEVVGTIPTMW
jgi:5'-nucleotidase